jgi:phage terminase large subunit GpA-like protein
MKERIPNSDIDFLREQFNQITDKREYELPSHYIERTRYLPKELTAIPGYYKFSTTPYLREILDNLSPESSIQKIVVMKAAQVGATTGILENYLAYLIGSNPRPVLYVTADKELAKLGMKTKIERMIDSCGLREKIFSQTGKQKATGDTVMEKEWAGAFLHAVGAQNPGKLRSMSYPVILFDELDAFSEHLGSEGSPVSLAENRTNAYAEKRKILYLSTPLITQSSKIYKLFLQGDQRQFYTPCIHCGEMQILVWHGINEKGATYGIVFDIIDGNPDFSTVGYKCQYCGKIMHNHDKAIFLPRGEWRSTAKSKEPHLISYQINALISPPGLYSWEKMVIDWVKCWDLTKNRMKDKEEYRTFRNTKQGLPFEEQGEQIRREKVQQFRNYKYLKNQINNKAFKEDSGSEILLLTSSVDVQKTCLFVHIIGWTIGGRNYTIDFIQIDGIVENKYSQVWKKLDELLIERTWYSDDDKEYRIIQTVIDSGHYTAWVYDFVNKYSSGIFAIKGEDYLTGGLIYKEFNRSTLEKAGLSVAFHLNTTLLKDRIAKIFNSRWETGKMQEEWYPNFAEDLKDDFYDQFEAEQKVDEYDKITNKWLRSRWRQIPGRENHSFDTYAYGLANLEILADFICRNELNYNYLNWGAFWDFAGAGIFYKDHKKKE